MPPGNLSVGFHRSSTFENSGKAIVIRGIDRIEFVIVTASASECHSHEDSTDSVNLLIDNVHPHFGHVDFGEYLWADRKKPGRDETLLPLLIRRDFKLISCQLLQNEAIKRFVGIE